MAPELRPRKPAGTRRLIDPTVCTRRSWLTIYAASAPAPAPKSAPKPKAAPAKRKAAEDASPVAPKKTKASKAETAPKKSTKTAKPVKPVKSAAKAKKEEPAEPEEAAEPAEPIESAEPAVDKEDSPMAEEENDQALALAGVSDNEDDDVVVDESVAFKEGQDVGKVPKASKAVEEAAKAGKSGKEGTGVVYIGRVPHGFYEHEMRSYFSQFGDITRLRCVIPPTNRHESVYANRSLVCLATRRPVPASTLPLWSFPRRARLRSSLRP